MKIVTALAAVAVLAIGNVAYSAPAGTYTIVSTKSVSKSGASADVISFSGVKTISGTRDKGISGSGAKSIVGSGAKSIIGSGSK